MRNLDVLFITPLHKYTSLQSSTAVGCYVYWWHPGPPRFVGYWIPLPAVVVDELKVRVVVEMLAVATSLIVLVMTKRMDSTQRNKRIRFRDRTSSLPLTLARCPRLPRITHVSSPDNRDRGGQLDAGDDGKEIEDAQRRRRDEQVPSRALWDGFHWRSWAAP